MIHWAVLMTLCCGAAGLPHSTAVGQDTLLCCAGGEGSLLLLSVLKKKGFFGDAGGVSCPAQVR